MPTANQPDEKDILAQNESLRGQVSTLTTQLTDANAALTAARTRIATLEGLANTSAGQVTAAEKRSTDAEARAATAEGSLAAKDTEIAQLKAEAKTAAKTIAEAGIVGGGKPNASPKAEEPTKSWTERALAANAPAAK
jgi:chromosome segregation ATPase